MQQIYTEMILGFLNVTGFENNYPRIVVTFCISLLLYKTLLICQTLDLFNKKIIFM